MFEAVVFLNFLYNFSSKGLAEIKLSISQTIAIEL